MKKFAISILILFLINGCAYNNSLDNKSELNSIREASSLSESSERIVDDLTWGFYIMYKDFLNDLNYVDIEESVAETQAKYEFRIFDTPYYSRLFYYYNIKIFADNSIDVKCLKMHWAGDLFDVDWKNEPEVVFEYNGQFSQEDTQDFLSIIEETNFWKIPDKGKSKMVSRIGREQICIEGYGENKRNCVVQTLEFVEGDKDEKIQKIHMTIREMVMSRIGAENFVDPYEG
ncbi:MAG TPA: hypothetical protein PK854_06960 [Oscillospiraceae bacterium]|nr:hypothetical protein [Oscillospiraceae bacterium]HPS34988.1 hypothetical protein [Oscillospiraceae bacterium]